ncbi:short-chain dehydrogenase/reductase [Nocardia sp. NPDC056100]|uniref:short-chain dehydrogenase/reductase n=1 Tax=Nocardia sp. NPDC056100 TaxID=3345712 RepID=UPI0035D6B1FB
MTMESNQEPGGRVVVITGAGSGIGAQTARLLVTRGIRVGLLDRDEKSVRAMESELGILSAACVADVTDTASLTVAMAAVADHFGGIDAIVANAGISGPGATVESIDPAEFERVIDINLLGVWRTVRAALPFVRERRGYVLAISSIAAVIPCPTMPAYAASKAGVEQFTRALRMELADTGIAVGTAYFGAIDTPMVARMRNEPGLNQLLERLGFAGRPVPVGHAAAAIVRGIESRHRTVSAPAYVPALLALRSVLAWTDPLLARLPAIRELVRDAAVANGASR